MQIVNLLNFAMTVVRAFALIAHLPGTSIAMFLRQKWWIISHDRHD